MWVKIDEGNIIGALLKSKYLVDVSSTLRLTVDPGRDAPGTSHRAGREVSASPQTPAQGKFFINQVKSI